MSTAAMRRFAIVLMAVLVSGCDAGTPSAADSDQSEMAMEPLREPDVGYEPSHPAIVQGMLKLADVNAQDIVYDLGSGDGRIPISAALDHGARAVGIEIDPKLIARARANAIAADVDDRVSFRNEDMFEADISDATVVTLFLYPEVNLKLRPKLLADLKPGTRVVSHEHDMGNWKPERTIEVRGHKVHLWRIPAQRGQRS